MKFSFLFSAIEDYGMNSWAHKKNLEILKFFMDKSPDSQCKKMLHILLELSPYLNFTTGVSSLEQRVKLYIKFSQAQNQEQKKKIWKCLSSEDAQNLDIHAIGIDFIVDWNRIKNSDLKIYYYLEKKYKHNGEEVRTILCESTNWRKKIYITPKNIFVGWSSISNFNTLHKDLLQEKKKYKLVFIATEWDRQELYIRYTSKNIS